METQKIANSLNSSENEFSKFATKNVGLVTAKQMVVIRITIQLNF